jgi:hypothetical protein
MLVQLEHESGGSREAAQVLHALDRELQHEARCPCLAPRPRPRLWPCCVLARLTGVIDELLGSQRHDDPSQDHGGVAGQ